MAARLFAFNCLTTGGVIAPGAKLNVFVRSTSTRTPWYTDVGLTVPATNPVIANANGLVSAYFQDTSQYTIRITTADEATTILEGDIVNGVLLVSSSSILILDPTWLPVISAPLGAGWADALANDFASETGSIDPADYGAMGDAIKGTDGVATAGDATFTSATLSATVADIGKVFIAHGAGTGGAPLVTTIASINSSTSIELATPAVTTVASNCAWTKSTNDTVALETAAAAAVSASLWLDLRGRKYGVTEFDLPKYAKLRDAEFIDIAPATNARKTLNHVGDYSGYIWLENIRIDRNGGSTSTSLFQNQALRLARLDHVRAINVEITGNDAGELFKFDTIKNCDVDIWAHDAHFVYSSQTDDTIEAVVFENCASIGGRVKIRKIGKSDQTLAARDALSRGLAIVGARLLVLDVNIERVDQPVDLSGAEPTLGSVRGVIRWGGASGWKAANAQSGLSTVGLTIDQCGLCGLTMGGPKPDEGDWSTWTQSILATGVVIKNIGTNGLWSGHAYGPAGVLVSRESAISPANMFPREITVTGNLIYSEQGSATFTANATTGICTAQENGMPISTGVQVALTSSGSLPTGYSATMYLIKIPSTRTFKLASSFINAQDEVAIIPSDTGSGTLTVTLVSNMKRRVSFTDITIDPAYPNFAFNNPGAGATVEDVQNGAPPAAVIREVAQSGQLQGFKNRLINGGFLCAQRTAASNADDTYTPLDRWYALTQSNAIAVTRLTDPETGAAFGARLTQSNASAQRMGLAQIIESVNCSDLRSTYAAFSGRVRLSTSANVRYAVIEWANADSVTSDIVADWTSSVYVPGAFFLASNLNVLASGQVACTANTWQNLPSLLALVGANLGNIIVLVWTEATAAQNVTLDLNRMQLEPGMLSTAFELRPVSVELALCQRYFEAGGGNAGPYWSGNTTSGEAYGSAAAFKVVKRVNPTVALTSVGNSGFAATSGTATPNVYGVSENRVATATDVARFYLSTYTADAEL